VLVVVALELVVVVEEVVKVAAVVVHAWRAR
jgi:hypothetical protein